MLILFKENGKTIEIINFDDLKNFSIKEGKRNTYALYAYFKNLNDEKDNIKIYVEFDCGNKDLDYTVATNLMKEMADAYVNNSKCFTIPVRFYKSDCEHNIMVFDNINHLVNEKII